MCELTQEEVDEFIIRTKKFTAELIAQGPEACQAFLDKVLPPIYPCDECASDGRCLKHSSCKEYQEYLRRIHADTSSQ